MSFAIVPPSILSAPDLTRLDHDIFTALKSHARPGKPLVWPSRTRLARLARCSLASVSRSLKRLVAAGWIIITRTGRANRVTCFDAPQKHISCAPTVTSTLIYEETTEISPLPPAGGSVSIVIDQDIGDQDHATEEEDITEDQAAFIIAFLNATTGSHLDTQAKPLVRLVNRRLRHYSPDQIKVAIAFYASLWRGTALEQHARNLRTVLSPTRIEFALAETARNQDTAKAQSSRLWKPEPPKPSDPVTARSALAGIRGFLRC